MLREFEQIQQFATDLVQAGLNDIQSLGESCALHVLEVAAQVGHRQASYGQWIGCLVPYPLRQGAKGGDPLHAHGGDSHLVQGLEIASPLQHAADGRREQAQVLLVVVGEPIAVAGGTGNLVD